MRINLFTSTFSIYFSYNISSYHFSSILVFAFDCLNNHEFIVRLNRTTGMSIGSMAARVGGMLSPVILEIQRSIPWFGQVRVLKLKVLYNQIQSLRNKIFKKFVWQNFLNVSVWFLRADSKNAISFVLSSIVLKIKRFPFFYDFPLTVDFVFSYACSDLTLSAWSCCKLVFYLLVWVNGQIGVSNLTEKDAFIAYQS